MFSCHTHIRLLWKQQEKEHQVSTEVARVMSERQPRLCSASSFIHLRLLLVFGLSPGSISKSIQWCLLFPSSHAAKQGGCLILTLHHKISPNHYRYFNSMIFLNDIIFHHMDVLSFKTLLKM